MAPAVQIRPIGKMPDIRRVAADGRAAFDESLNEIGRFAQGKFQAITSGWKHKPTFEIVRTPYTVSIKVTGPNKKIWEFVDLGTARHVIKAKGGGRKRGAKLLTFRTGYQAKSKPNNSVYKGSGKSSGNWVSKKQVVHPGNKPRNFTRIVLNQSRDEGRKIIRRNLQKKRIPV